LETRVLINAVAESTRIVTGAMACTSALSYVLRHAQRIRVWQYRGQRGAYMRLIGCMFLLMAFAHPLSAQEGAAEIRKVRILFIGNSYTSFNDLPRTLQAMALASEPSVAIEVGTALAGGATLKQHWGDTAVIQKIRHGDWDYVVLQEQSLLPIQTPDTLLTYAERFGELIRSVQATPVLFMTWARQNRSSSQDTLDQSFLRVVDQIGALPVPVGAAWKEFGRQEPSQALHAQDGSHPSPLGSYVAASTFYRVLFKKQVPESFPFGFETKINGQSGAVERVGAIRIPPGVTRAVQRAVEAALVSQQLR
jgi:hypothetical protein